MNRQLIKLVEKSRVHQDEYDNAFNNKTVSNQAGASALARRRMSDELYHRGAI